MMMLELILIPPVISFLIPIVTNKIRTFYSGKVKYKNETETN